MQYKCTASWWFSFLCGDPYQNRTGVAAVRGRSLNRLTNGPLVHHRGLEPRTHWLRVSCSTNWANGAKFGSPSWTRTNDPAVNSRMLYRLSYWGIWKKVWSGQTRPSFLCRRYLSSRAVASQVFSAQMSLTAVFGMGTGGPSPQSTPTIFQPVAQSKPIWTFGSSHGAHLSAPWEWCAFTDSNRGPTD